MNSLFIEDLDGCSYEDVIEHIVSAFEIEEKDLSDYTVLVGYESVGNWGCDSSNWFLLQHKESGEFYEVHGSHCSCYGFEDQWDLEHTTLDYLQSDKFYLPTGGYDYDSESNKLKVKQFLKELS